MLFVFKGTEDGPESTTLYGINFRKGELTEVDDSLTFEATGRRQLSVVDKLSMNPQFEVKQSTFSLGDKHAGGSSSTKGAKTSSKNGS